MIDGLKPYPAMKDSGVPWLGQVPEQWDVRKLRQCASIEGGMTPSMETSRYWDGTIPWVTPKDMKRSLLGDSSVRVTHNAIRETSLHLIPEPAVLMVVRGMILARTVPFASTIAPVTVNQDMKALLPKLGVVARFLEAFLSAAQDAFVPMIDEAGHGTRRLPTERWRDLSIALPPEQEQAAIVRFLDHADRHIRRYIRAKQELITLLVEQKQAIIHRAVTRGLPAEAAAKAGLNPNVRLKPSGVEWLGDVPEHWGVIRLKSLVRRIDQGVSPQAENSLAEDGSWGVLKAGCVNRGVFREEQHKRLPERFKFDPALAVAAGDVLISRASGSPHFVGSVGRVSSLRFRLILSDKTFRPVFGLGVDPDFMLLAMNSRYYRDQVEQAISGAEGLANNLPLSSLRAFSFAVPPLHEQHAIVGAFRGLMGMTAEAAANVEREITLLREYRNRLIADVVTGKLDVREASAFAEASADRAAGLPDEAEESEPLDEVEVTGADGVGDNDADTADEEAEA